MRFPEKEQLLDFAEYIGASDKLVHYLPIITETWAEKTEAIVRTVQLATAFSPPHSNLAHSGADLFYKIIKDHPHIDGNKRTAVMSVVLFFGLNRQRLVFSFQDMYRLSKSVAESRLPQEQAVKNLAVLFQSHLKPLLP